MSKQPAALMAHPPGATIKNAVTLPQPTVSAWQAINWISDRTITTRWPVFVGSQYYFPGDMEGFTENERLLVAELARGGLVADGYRAQRTNRGLVGSGDLVPIPQQVFKDPGVGIWWEGWVTNRLVRNEPRLSYDGPRFVEVQFLTDDVLRLWPAEAPAAPIPIASLKAVATPKRGPKAEVRMRVESAMRAGIAAGTLSREELSLIREKEFKHRFGAGRTSVRDARKNVLAETPTNSDK